MASRSEVPIREAAPHRPVSPYGAIEARLRAHDARFRPRARPPLDAAPLLQRRRRRSGRRDRRMARAGDASDPARARRGARPPAAISRFSAPTTRPRTARRSATTSTSWTSPTRMSRRCDSCWTAAASDGAQSRHRAAARRSRELIRTVEEVTGANGPRALRAAPRRRPAGPRGRSCGAPSRSSGWRAKRDLDDMIATAWRWHQTTRGIQSTRLRDPRPASTQAPSVRRSASVMPVALPSGMILESTACCSIVRGVEADLLGRVERHALRRLGKIRVGRACRMAGRAVLFDDRLDVGECDCRALRSRTRAIAGDHDQHDQQQRRPPGSRPSPSSRACRRRPC